MAEQHCPWCESPFEARQSGGSKQRFCSSACRQGFHRAARRYVAREIAAGRLTVARLRNATETACTPLTAMISVTTL